MRLQRVKISRRNDLEWKTIKDIKNNSKIKFRTHAILDFCRIFTSTVYINSKTVVYLELGDLCSGLEVYLKCTPLHSGGLEWLPVPQININCHAEKQDHRSQSRN